MEERYCIDRIEGETAVCEHWPEGGYVEFKTEEIPAGIKEGDIFVRRDGFYEIEEELTRKRREEMKNRMNRLFQKPAQE